jgi:GNAT superfamily N-acetyltransferase
MHAQIETVYHTDDAPIHTGFEIRQVRMQEEARLLSTLTSAFINDPPGRWLYPEPHDYLRCFPAFARAFGGGALALGSAWCMEDLSAVACWFPPKTGPDETSLMAVIENSMPAQRHSEVFGVFEALGEAHPCEPHWYLPLIGVDAACQGHGRGSALLRATLAVCDRGGLLVDLNQHLLYPIPGFLAGCWFLSGLFEFCGYGLIAAWLYPVEGIGMGGQPGEKCA